ncbi:hypothetical protein AST12_03320 [Staphylococcus succinus]|nr:hypothetical protein AST12_03320 [Staphylococcus succinus]
MKADGLTHILLLIVGLLLLLNGCFAFDKSLAMTIVSSIFIIVGLMLSVVSSKLFYNNIVKQKLMSKKDKSL